MIGSRLGKLEKVIERGLGTFYEVGAALKEIRDEKLYGQFHESFEDYCKERWGMALRYAQFHIRSSETVVNLKANNCSCLPANESQTRPLTRLAGADQQEAWQAVLENAPETSEGTKLITAELVSQVVAEMFPKKSMIKQWTLHTGTETLRKKIEWIAARWPEHHITVLSDELRILANEVPELIEELKATTSQTAV